VERGLFPYLLRRLITMIPVLVGVLVITFVIMRVIPGDPAILILGPQANAAQIKGLEHAYGFDQPIPVQFLVWVRALLRGDFGTSVYWNKPVLPLVLSKVEPSFWQAGLAIIFLVLVGVTVGTISALKRDTWIDQSVLAGTVAAASLPSFWTSLVLMWIFAVILRILPSSGFESIILTRDPSNLKYLVMPAFAIALPDAALLTRLTRSSMLDVLSKDYVNTARAKGLREPLVILRHVLRNASVPILTVISYTFLDLLSKAVVTEQIFNLPGIGKLVYSSVLGRDYPVVQGVLLVIAVGYVVINLFTDMLYVFLDPRIRY